MLLFPVQAMSNLYEMYYAQAMNHKLYEEGNPEANDWADKVEACFARDKALSEDYNNVMSNGKWKGMMTQKHIGYTSWNDDFSVDKQPEVFRLSEENVGDTSLKEVADMWLWKLGISLKPSLLRASNGK